MDLKRRRLSSPAPPHKRHRPNRPTPILHLSDEIFLRICSFLAIRDLTTFQLVSKRCQRVAVDGQIWKALYYRRYVRPRALKIPGLLRPSQLHYSSRDSRWLEEEGIAREVGTNWKGLYKLRHNWGIGACVVREIDVAGDDAEVRSREERGLLVKLHGGTVFTASAAHGLRAYRLHSSDDLIAHTSLYSTRYAFSRLGPPTALAVDPESGRSDDVRLVIGFTSGTFALYGLSHSHFHLRYVHAQPRSSKITAIAALGPYLTTMREHTWDIFDFSPASPAATTSGASESGHSPRAKDDPAHMIHAPKILTSLRSSTAWPPISLSLRRSVASTLLAAIVYAQPLYLSGWSVGMQELRFSTEEAGYAKLSGSRVASAVPTGFTPLQGRGGIDLPPPMAQPNSLSYCHPYLLASHPDNTLSLHLVRSTGSLLAIDPGQRLYGHTSAVSSAQVDSRGKAVSINRNGLEMRVWELEGGISARRRVSASVKVEPVRISVRGDVISDASSGDRVTTAAEGYLGGFDEEKVVVLRGDTSCLNAAAGTLGMACAEGRLALVVYDFNR